MQNALLVGLSRQMSLSHQIDIIAGSNIANIDTTGFKSDSAAFSEYLGSGASDGDFAGKDRRVSFVQDHGTWIDFSPGGDEARTLAIRSTWRSTARAWHSRRAGLDREIECASDSGNDADDRDHPQLFRHRSDPAAARRPAPELAAAARASDLGLMVRIKDHACA